MKPQKMVDLRMCLCSEQAGRYSEGFSPKGEMVKLDQDATLKPEVFSYAPLGRDLRANTLHEKVIYCVKPWEKLCWFGFGQKQMHCL